MNVFLVFVKRSAAPIVSYAFVSFHLLVLKSEKWDFLPLCNKLIMSHFCFSQHKLVKLTLSRKQILSSCIFYDYVFCSLIQLSNSIIPEQYRALESFVC